MNKLQFIERFMSRPIVHNKHEDKKSNIKEYENHEFKVVTQGNTCVVVDKRHNVPSIYPSLKLANFHLASKQSI